MSQKQEVEIRAKVSFEAGEKVIKELIEMGAKYSNSAQIDDMYYCPKTVKDFSETEMDEIGSYSLRLRSSSKNKGEPKFSINTKVITSFGDHSAWDEFESEVTSLEQMAHILDTLSFKKFFEISKKRESYEIDDIKMEIEEVKDFGYVIEAEIMVEASESAKAKQRILDLFDKLKIARADIFPKSATNYLMRLWAKF
jgi:predicted adenylyl cyclase CyaB